MRHLILGIFLFAAAFQSVYAQTGKDTTKLPEGLSTFIDEPDTFFWHFDLDTTTACPIAHRYLMAFLLYDLTHPDSDGEDITIEFTKHDETLKQPYGINYTYRMFSSFDVGMSPSVEDQHAWTQVGIETSPGDPNQVGGYRIFQADFIWEHGRCTSVQVSSSEVAEVYEGGGGELGASIKDRKALEKEFIQFIELLEEFEQKRYKK